MADDAGKNGGDKEKPAGGEGGGGGNGGDGGEPTAKKHDRKDVDEVVDRLVSRYGTERAALRVLADENLDHRETARQLKTKIAKDGEVILSADDAKRWAAFQALGKKPEEITAAISENETLRAESAATKQKDVHRKAAEAVGYDADVLDDFATTRKLRIEMRDTDVVERGKKEKKPLPYVVTGEGTAAKAEPLTDVVERDFKKYEPALRADVARRPAGTNGVTYPAQEKDGSAHRGTLGTPAEVSAELKSTGLYSQV